ncbi:hypothetical protein [Gluconacetobacter sp.]|uniref:hypothetical protein n=1 Tax=Gluconacetobacter sp. TaxID=1935994 RepID=UPI0039EC8E36
MEDKEIRMRCLELAATHTNGKWTYAEIADVAQRLAATVTDGCAYGNFPRAEPVVCPWCWREADKVNRLLVLNNNGICFECVDMAAERVRSLREEGKVTLSMKEPTP